MHVRLHAGEVVAHGGRTDDAGARVAERTTEFCTLPARRDRRGARRRARGDVRAARRGAHRLSRAARARAWRSRASCRSDRSTRCARCSARCAGWSSPSSSRPDECCGFGGTFAVGEPAVSAKMGRDRLRDYHVARRAGGRVHRHVVPHAPRRARAARAHRPADVPRRRGARRHGGRAMTQRARRAARARRRTSPWITRPPRRRSTRTSRAPTGTTRRSGSCATKRDRAAAAVPDWEALRARASAIKEHALTHLDEYLEQFEANALRERDAGALGARRGRAQPDRARDSRAARRATAREEQVDAHRGVRAQPVPRGARHRGGRHRPRRADRAASPRGAEPHRAAGDPPQEGGGGRHLPRAPRHAGRLVRSRPRSRARAREHLREQLPRRRRDAHRRELRRRRDGRLRRVHERGERRSRHGARAGAHRVHGDREDDPARRGPRRVPAAARAQRDGAAGDGVHARTSTARAPGRSCTSCSWTTAARGSSRARSSGARSSASAAARA